MEPQCRQVLWGGFPVAVSMDTKPRQGKLISRGSSASLRCDSVCVWQIEIPIFKRKDYKELKGIRTSLTLECGNQENSSNTQETEALKKYVNRLKMW